MFLDRQHRLLSYHDTWLSLDPIRGCPYRCSYCVLRHAGATGTSPIQSASPQKCVQELVKHPFFVPTQTPLAIGNETDMLHPRNCDYLLNLLAEIKAVGVNNSISLITKAPLSKETLDSIRRISGNQIRFFRKVSPFLPTVCIRHWYGRDIAA